MMTPQYDVQLESTLSDGVEWLDYEAALLVRGANSLPRFNYYRGVLETVTPGPKHAKQVRRLASLVETVTEMWEIDSENLGSTTFKREEIACGFEPDCCFYMDSLDALEDTDDVNLDAGDPLPDLVLEIQSTEVFMPKLPLYAAIGVPEVWQIDGVGSLRIFLLDGPALVEASASGAFYKITTADLNNLLQYGGAATGVEWLKRVREWVFNL